MARLPNLTDRNQLPEHLHEAYDRVAGLRQGAVSGPYGVLLHSPELAERGAALSNYLRWNAALSPVQVETAVLTAAREYEAAVMWAGHVRLALEAGIPQATIDAIAERLPIVGDTFSEEEAAIIRYVRELLVDKRVSQSSYDALLTRLGTQGLVDLTGLVGYYGFVASVLNAFEIEPGADAPRLPNGPAAQPT